MAKWIVPGRIFSWVPGVDRPFCPPLPMIDFEALHVKKSKMVAERADVAKQARREVCRQVSTWIDEHEEGLAAVRRAVPQLESPQVATAAAIYSQLRQYLELLQHPED